MFDDAWDESYLFTRVCLLVVGLSLTVTMRNIFSINLHTNLTRLFRCYVTESIETLTLGGYIHDLST
jgi:hypothetical protein